MTAGRTVLALPLTDIVVGERVGFFHPPHAERLGARMAAEGQHDPIHVRRNGNAAKVPWTLVAGLHRLRGAAIAGLPTIDAVQVADASSSTDELRRLELSENLDHRQRRPIERAILMTERARLEEALDHPDHVGEARADRAARTRWHASATVAEACDDATATIADASWIKRAATALGCSERTLRHYQRLHRDIVQALPDLAQPLNFHPLGESLSAMIRLAQIKRVEARRQVAEAIVADADMPSVEEAFACVTNGPRKGDRAPAAALDARAFAHWRKLGAEQQHGLAVEIADTIPDLTAFTMIARFKARGLL